MTAKTHRLMSAAPTKPEVPIPYGSVALPVSPGDVIRYRLRSMAPGDAERVCTVDRVLETGTIVTSDEVYLYRSDLVDLVVDSQPQAGRDCRGVPPHLTESAAGGEPAVRSTPAPRAKSPKVTNKPRHCATCGTEYIPSGNRQKHCPLHSRKVRASARRQQVPDKHDGPQGSAPHPQRPTAGDGGADAAGSAGTPSVPAVARQSEGSGETSRPGGASGQSHDSATVVLGDLAKRLRGHAERLDEAADLHDRATRALAILDEYPQAGE